MAKRMSNPKAYAMGERMEKGKDNERTESKREKMREMQRGAKAMKGKSKKR